MPSSNPIEDWTGSHHPNRSALKQLWKSVLPGAGAAAKLSRILPVGLTQLRNNQEMASVRSDRGADIITKLGMGEYLFFQLGSAEPPKGIYGKGFDFGIGDPHK